MWILSREIISTTSAYRGNFNPRPFPSNSSNNYGNSYGNQSYNNNRNTSDLENNIKEFINTQKVFNTSIEEKLNKIDDLSRSVDRIAHDVENLKMKFFVPKVDESIKALYVSMDESKKRTAMLRARREFLEQVFSSDCFHKSDEYFKIIGISSIHYLFGKIKIEDKGTEEESTLARRRPDNSGGENLDEKIDKSGLGEVKTLTSDVPTLLDYKDFNYDSCSLIECISLLQSMVNSPLLMNKINLLLNILWMPWQKL